MSPTSPEKGEVEAVAVIPVYPKADDDDVLVNATILNEEDHSNDRDDNKVSKYALEESVEVTMEDEDEDSSVACAVVVAAEVEADSISKEYKSSQSNVKPEEEKNTAPSSSRTKSKKRKRADSIPSVKDLGIPFRAIKRIMKIDPDIMVVQNEAAIITTYALELFVQKIVHESYINAKKRGRNTVK